MNNGINRSYYNKDPCIISNINAQFYGGGRKGGEALFLGYLFIFVARLIDVSLQTTRLLFIVRGGRLQAALIGFVEVIVYILALNRVVQHLDNIYNLFAYALGFATGNYVGSLVEEKMALGYVTVQVVSKDDRETLAPELRRKGYGVTVIEGMGKEGARQILNILTKRKDLHKLMDIINSLEHDAFVTVMDAKFIHGGFLGQKAK